MIDSKQLSDSIEEFVKDAAGDGTLVTGWLVIASTLHSDGPTTENGFTYASSEHMPAFLKLGLTEAVSQDIRNQMLIGDSRSETS
jgi:hypothetical protein